MVVSRAFLVLVLVPESVSCLDSLLAVYFAVLSAFVKAGLSRHTSTGRTKTRFRVRPVGAIMKWDDVPSLADVRTYFESLNKIVFAMQEDGTLVGADIDVTCIYMQCRSAWNPLI